MRRIVGAAAAVLLIGTLSACGMTIPTDPDGTLDGIVGGDLRVGYSPEPGLIEAGAEGPTGPLADLVQDYARSEGAEAVWSRASEETLVDALDRGALDLAVGGFTDQAPWTDRAALSRPFTLDDVPNPAHVSIILVPAGENAMLSSVESFLDEEGLT
ncbi:hypothetical protein [Microbacterium gubbeenense]|uniref:hypothetical protein n=1 Tax=Microbacterium gubbeenense TaxID=159896 RepID=UPI003F9BFC0E